MSIHKASSLGYSVTVGQHIPANFFIPSGRFEHLFPDKMHIAVRLACTGCRAELYRPSGENTPHFRMIMLVMSHQQIAVSNILSVGVTQTHKRHVRCYFWASGVPFTLCALWAPHYLLDRRWAFLMLIKKWTTWSLKISHLWSFEIEPPGLFFVNPFLRLLTKMNPWLATSSYQTGRSPLTKKN